MKPLQYRMAIRTPEVFVITGANLEAGMFFAHRSHQPESTLPKFDRLSEDKELISILSFDDFVEVFYKLVLQEKHDQWEDVYTIDEHWPENRSF